MDRHPDRTAATRPAGLTARLRRVVPWSPALLATAAAAGIVAELAWTVHRPLPGLVGLDASGLVPGAGVGAPVRLVALGDSSLTGPGLDDPDAIWLRQALVALHLDRPVALTSLAVGGSRTADVTRRVPEAVALEPDVVVVAVGSNDVVHGTPTRQVVAHLDDVLRHLGAAVPVLAVANVGDLGNVARVRPPLENALRLRSRRVRLAIEAVVARHPSAVLLDVTPADVAFRDPTVFAPDLFHPGPEGHARWADAARPGLQEAFGRVGVGSRAAVDATSAVASSAGPRR
ncbi:GDSL-type esterase/lipase family protein [Iamia majanohamensis]|uniref:GDSL-type esterase/lipase family protein n=1 Tax=Iamia majanohamensis TaxID=467976 RepID=A0AAF0BV69_9ACTN|nr:GDSL-type esterase/lipase family protein [Iamia majanohamensis]WCO66803.1 GDSL-type esterase/lipase family protein [Iamia majanohamensis]